MKKVCVFCVVTFFCNSIFAKLITVSNNANSPGQYNNLQTAIDAALTGDTLLVTGSPTSYADISINNKTLTLLGQGYDPRKDISFASTVDRITLNSGSDGTIILGFKITSYITSADGIKDIVIKRNNCETIYINGNGFLITDNIISSGTINISKSTTNTLIKNNVFSTTGTAIYGEATATNILITNNSFTYLRNSELSVSNAVISNNIFYHKTNTAVNVNLLSDAQNCQVNNNITFNNTNTNPFNIGTKNITGTANQINVNPLFVTYDVTTSGITRNDNLQLQAGSPAKNAGTDGTDIGPYGGATPMQYPLSGEPAIPQITEMSIINTVIPPTGTLNVKVKARSNN